MSDGAAAVRALSLHIQALLRDEPGLQPPTTLLVALSGGLDSVCLLHLLRFATPPARLCAAHFDHAMRASSGADADWVRGLCRAWSVPLDIGRADQPPRSEAAARTLRHAFLAECAARRGASLILTAHHADDQAETVLFRLARGTGLPGLAGIAARRGDMYRPLLGFTRAHLRAYASACRLTWQEDPSNVDLRYSRNRIRHRVLPALEAVRPGAAGRIAALASRVAEAESAWRQVVEAAERQVVVAREERRITLARERLLFYHPHIRTRVLRHLLQQLGGMPERAGTRAAMEFINSGGTGSRIELRGGVVLVREWDRLLLERAHPVAAAADTALEIHSAAAGSGPLVVGGRHYVARWALAEHGDVSADTATFDPSALRFPLVLRSWRPGDRIRLPRGSRKLKKLFLERRIGRDRRSSIPVLSDAAGRVLWVRGVARGACAAPAPGQTVFEISVVDGNTG